MKKTTESDHASLLLPTQEDVEFDLMTQCRSAVRKALQLALDEELRLLVGADPNERTPERQDVRNGSYSRKPLTSMGKVEVEVGRTRKSGAAGKTLGRYKRRMSEIDDAIIEAYVRGISSRDMTAITEALTGESVGRSTVSRVTKRLEEEVESLRKQRIDEPIAYLYLDATFINARWTRSVENVSALVAYGVGPDGYRRLLAVTIGAQESEDSWSELLEQLIERGLHGVELVISDEHKGLIKAVQKQLPEARRQRCTVHLTRNVMTKVPMRHRKRISTEALAVLHAPDLETAQTRLESFRQRLEDSFPEAVDCLAEGFHAATQYFAFPKAHRKRLRSTNSLERLHGEIKRRTKTVGSFPDRQSALRLITAVALQVTEIWNDRRYLDMTLLSSNRKHAHAA